MFKRIFFFFKIKLWSELAKLKADIQSPIETFLGLLPEAKMKLHIQREGKTFQRQTTLNLEHGNLLISILVEELLT